MTDKLVTIHVEATIGGAVPLLRRKSRTWPQRPSAAMRAQKMMAIALGNWRRGMRSLRIFVGTYLYMILHDMLVRALKEPVGLVGRAVLTPSD